jgi:hypothetical protein
MDLMTGEMAKRAGVNVETLRFLLNGREVNRVEADRTIVCHPGLQANGTDIRFRNVVLTPLKAGDAAKPAGPSR